MLSCRLMIFFQNQHFQKNISGILPDKTSGLIWFKAVGSFGIFERNFEKINFDKKSADDKDLGPNDPGLFT